MKELLSYFGTIPTAHTSWVGKTWAESQALAEGLRRLKRN